MLLLTTDKFDNAIGCGVGIGQRDREGLVAPVMSL